MNAFDGPVEGEAIPDPTCVGHTSFANVLQKEQPAGWSCLPPCPSTPLPSLKNRMKGAVGM
jgi:hypothetical protein